MKLLKLLFGLTAPIDRKTYLLAGVSLGALKYLIDVIVVYLSTGKLWTLWAYFTPVVTFRNDLLRPAPEMLLWGMAAYSLPFAWVGLSMSVRRAANAGISPWFGVGFLLPVLNWLTIVVLSLKPTSGYWDIMEKGEPVSLKLRTALLSMGIGVALSMSMVATSVYVLKDYGWSLFIGTPFVVGITAGYLTNRSGRSSLGASLWTALMTIVLSGLATLLFALEGFICVAMAAIPAAIVAMAGAVVGRAIAAATRGSSGAGLIMLALLLPLIAGAESLDTRTTEREVVTALEIDAPPSEVWEHVIHFSAIKPPARWLRRLGVAYPTHARLEGEGVGAVRHCEFTTGPFVEPITAWQPGERLAFDVSEQPPPLEEWSPYQNVHPPHLDGYFRSQRGEFKLVDLGDGRTRLEGRTWYEIDIAPQSYWSLWGDTIIHRIHLHVLEHVKSQAEVDADP